LKQTVLVAGAGGQLGRELLLTASPEIQCQGLNRHSLDISDPGSIYKMLDEHRPQVLVNAAAYTAVDTAETEAEQAWSINALAPGYLAEACARRGVRLIHLSTDFVFDGEAQRPYQPGSATAPVSEYGRGKLAGEKAVMEALPGALIVRTSWVYSRFGSNFVKTMLRLMTERDELGVVCDQIGTPTWARGLAQAIWAAVRRPEFGGVYHWSDGGLCSWYDFAQAIYEEGRAVGILVSDTTVKPIPGSSYPTPAHRPAYSVLDKTKTLNDFELNNIAWREQLRSMLLDMKEHSND